VPNCVTGASSFWEVEAVLGATINESIHLFHDMERKSFCISIMSAMHKQ